MNLKIFFVATILFFSIVISNAVATKIYVPEIIDESLVSGETFTVDVSIEDVTDLFGWEFDLNFNPNVLEALSVTEGPFLKQGGNTMCFGGTINNDVGIINNYACVLFGPHTGVSGSGTLASVNFRVKDLGYSVLDLSDTKLQDSDAKSISHVVEDGYFCNNPPCTTTSTSTTTTTATTTSTTTTTGTTTTTNTSTTTVPATTTSTTTTTVGGGGGNGGNGGNGDDTTTSTTTTSTTLTTTGTTTVPVTTTTIPETTTTTIPEDTTDTSNTIKDNIVFIAVGVIVVVAVILAIKKFGFSKGKEAEFKELKEKWGR